ncbi:hypothetical protein [Sphingomonas sp. 32-62-10]|nr:MAG: hypothetical protein B7Y98_06185 [Sphingomonas sp. 32-62-10]
MDEFRGKLLNASHTEALDAAHEYFVAVGMSREELRPILRLMGALYDHQNGKPNSLIAVKKLGGQKTPIADIMFKSCCAVTMTILMEAGRDKVGAAAEISTALRKAGRRIDSKTIEGWHRTATRNKPGKNDPRLSENYVAMIADLDPQMPPSEIAAGLIVRLPHLLTQSL